ncbi:MAG: hypothetical protein ACXW05_07760 [Gemmatirosa sp.]
MQPPDQVQPPTPPELPSPPSPAEAPPAPTPNAVSRPEGTPIPLQGLPRTAQEVRGLRERREILRDQLERATNRRDNLVNELNSGSEGDQPLAPEARAGIEQRLRVVDERIIQLERDQALTERLLSNAPPAVLAQAAEVEQHERNSMSEDDAAGIAVGTFGAGILLTLIVGRIRRGIRRRRGGPAAQIAALPADDPRIDRLTQTMDAIAEEVERIGEGQRFVTQLLATRRQEAPMLSGEPDRR